MKHECLPGPTNSIIRVKGTKIQNANTRRHPRRRRGDAVSPIFIVANFNTPKSREEKEEEEKKNIKHFFL